MSTTNGDGKLRVDPSLLTIGDLKRAKIILKGRDPWEVLASDPLEAVQLTIWCLKSRTDPGYTWEMAEAEPLGTFDMAGDVPPPTPPLEASGESEPTPSGNGSNGTPQPPTTVPSSAPSST